ncbi:MAG: hypothetical protein NC432_05280 [Roseburia sp.]|nr:hypothetical protein [Roseburia sp.]MCM1097920.1 hypothetical protein [Ruminococcus flavefaciens]
MKKRKMILTALAASTVLVSMSLASGIENAWAYFTTNTNASGSHTVTLADEITRIDESFDFADWTKTLTVTNQDTSGRPVYVRAKVFSGDSYPVAVSGTGWGDKAQDDYYYYGSILEIGASTGDLTAKINGVPQEITDPQSFNVVIIYETTPVQYDAAGNPYADWSLTLQTEEGGN